MEDIYKTYRDFHENKGYKISEIDDIPMKDFNNIFASDAAKGIRRAKSGDKSPEEVLRMI